MQFETQIEMDSMFLCLQNPPPSLALVSLFGFVSNLNVFKPQPEHALDK